MNLATMLPSLAQMPSSIGMSSSAGDLIEITRILLFFVVIVACGSVAVRFTGRWFEPPR